MNSVLPSQAPQAFPFELNVLRQYWCWLLAGGIAFIVLGLVALGCLPFVTEAAILYYGFVLIASGIVSGIQAFRLKVGSGFFLALIIGVLDVVVGFLMLTHTLEAALIMTLLLAVFFLASGLFRVIMAIVVRPPQWGWLALAGVVTLLLGASIWKRWPWSSFWVIGLFVGVELLMRGWAMVMLGLAARRLPDTRSAIA